MSDGTPGLRATSRTLALVALAGALGAAGAAALYVGIFDRRQEASNPFFRVVRLDEETVDPAVWGRNFPVQYESYRRTVDQQRTRFGGSEALPRVPTSSDPRSVVAQSRLEGDPRLRTMWAGYPFSVDFREERGHAFMLDDQSYSRRVSEFRQPGACLHCHASTYAAYRKLGGGDLALGFEKLSALPYEDARKLVDHPVSCIDCHDPATLALRVTRPAFIEAIRAARAAAGEQGYDVNARASREEMRSFVCGQCHAEYYIRPSDSRLSHPWSRGLGANQQYQYYDAIGYSDWTHADTGAPVLKVQHPEFEMWSQGVHARSGVACADCHMPYMRVGSLKVSDHHVRSPLLNVNRACQTCHRWSEQELVGRAEGIQEKTVALRGRAMSALVDLVSEITQARRTGATEADLAKAQQLQREGQFLVDFVESENSTGFHAPAEASRILAEAIDLLRQGQLAVRRPGNSKGGQTSR